MTKALSRRRFMLISAAAAGLPLIMGGSVLAASDRLYRWKGKALGAYSEMLLNLPDGVDGDALMTTVHTQVTELEKVFSIYRADSALTFLNQNGYLLNPPPALLDILRQANDISRLSGGAFDVTVQPLWQLHTQMQGRRISASLGQKVLELVDYQAMRLADDEIRFHKPGMAITLNGIAQGYITDRVTQILKSHGLTNCLVQLGETRALGTHPSGRDWHLEIKNQGGKTVPLNNRALATSAPSDRLSPIFNPKAQATAAGVKSISVIAPTATRADGLSTAFAVLGERQRQDMQRHLKDTLVIVET